MKRIPQFLASRLKVSSMDPDEGMQEYALKINLFSMMCIAAVSALLSMTGYIFSNILLDTFLIMFFLSLFFMAAWLMAGTKNWKRLRIIPVGTIYLVAVYGNFVGGIGAPAMLIYILAIVLASQLYGKRMQFMTIGVSILSFTVIALLHYKDLIPAPRKEAAAFQNRLFITISLMLMIGILLRFIISQLEKTAQFSRNNEQEIAATNEELLAANEEYEAQNEELIGLNQDLEKSERALRSIFEATPVGIGLLIDRRFTQVNATLCRITGYTEKELIGQSTKMIYTDDNEYERVGSKIYEDMKQDGVGFIEASLRRKNGQLIFALIGAAPFNPHDDSAGFCATIQDITKQKNAENTLREQEGVLRSILDAAPIGIGLLIDRRFTKVNASFCKMTGYTEEEAMGQLTEIIYENNEMYEKKGKEIYLDMMKNGIGSMEMLMRRKNGELFHALLSLAPSDPNDISAGVCATAFDISKLKTAEMEKERMQKQLAQAQKMEAVGTLTGGIAHDFNNMLTGIMGSLSMLETMVSKKEQLKPDSLKKYIETAQESSRRAADMIKQLMTFSRKSELKLSTVDINLSLKHIQKICQNSFPKSINLDFTIEESPSYIQADPVEIEQVLLNLCVNASHAMTFMRPEGERQEGTLSVSAKEIECSDNFCALHQDAIPGKRYVIITVNDTGIGIEEETRSQIFDPFFTTKNNHEGTGLGLSMAYGIVKQHDGFIDVYSEAGTGSAFNVYLPATEEAASAEGRDSFRPELTTGSGIILVVDDEKSILGVASGMLEQCGYQVMTAKDGASSVELYQREHQDIDAVLLDLSMPGMSGLEVFEELKKISPGVKVLMSSGLMNEEQIRNAFKNGVKGFLQKPYSVVDLSIKMKEIIEA